MLYNDKFSLECGDFMDGSGAKLKYHVNSRKKMIVVFIVIFVIVGIIIYFKNANNGILINEDNIKSNNFDVANLIGSWETHLKTETKDNKYYIYDMVLVFNKDGTCNLDGSMRVRRTDNNGGSYVTINQEGKCYLNSTGDKLKMDTKNDKSLVFYDEWTDFKLSDELLMLSNFSYNKHVSN